MPAFLSTPSPTEILIILAVLLFFIGPMVLACAVVLLRGKDYDEPEDGMDIPMRRRSRRR